MKRKYALRLEVETDDRTEYKRLRSELVAFTARIPAPTGLRLTWSSVDDSVTSDPILLVERKVAE